MKPLLQPFYAGWWFAVTLLFAAACRHAPDPGPTTNLPTLPPLRLPPPPAMKFNLPAWQRSVDPRRLDVAEFIPPGARRVGPATTINLQLATETPTKFPSTESCASPDQRAVLFHDGTQRSSLILHWLMLLKKDVALPIGVYCTTTSFETMWSRDSGWFAITDFSGQNRSEVFIEELNELRRDPIDVRPLVEEFFPLHLLSAPMFVKAYRWTIDGKLVVRAIGRGEEAPFEEFGCELLVTPRAAAADPVVTWLNGYILPQEPP
jgi:hypothetical protein